MMPTADPRRQLQGALGAASLGAILLIGGAAAWAFSAPALPALADLAVPVPLPRAEATSPVDAQAWTVTLWRPLVDTPAASDVQVPLKLFSILRQGDELIAALDADQAGLIYARAGDVVHGYRIDAIEAAAVVLVQGSQSQRLELAP